MGDKIEHFSLLCMKIGTALFIATVICTIGCISGFVLSDFCGFKGLLMDFVTFAFGACGFVVGLYSAADSITWLDKIFE